MKNDVATSVLTKNDYTWPDNGLGSDWLTEDRDLFGRSGGFAIGYLGVFSNWGKDSSG